jgi:hypothetical protein
VYNNKPVDTIGLVVVLPKITMVQKVIWTVNKIETRTLVVYSVTISNAPGSATSSFNIVILDSLSKDFILVYKSINTTSGIVANSTSFVVVYPFTFLSIDAPIVIYYTLILTTYVRANTLVFGKVSITYQTAPDSIYNTSEVLVGPVYYITQIMIASPSTVFTLNSTSISNGNSISIGEILNYTITIYLL